MSDLISKPSHLTIFGAVADEGAGLTDPLVAGSTATSLDPARILAADSAGPPRDRSPPTQSEVTSSGLPTPGCGSSDYRVGFYNETADSTGHEHHVCQGEVDVTASGTDQAVADAVVEFEKHEEVSTWRDRAQSIECAKTAGKE